MKRANDEKELRKEIQDWVDSWWKDGKPPETLKQGQVWTVFHPAGPPEKEGTMVCIFSIHGDQAYIFPLHTRMEASTEIEPLLTEESPPFHVPIVAVVEGGLLVVTQAFQQARFIGAFSENSMNKIRQCFNEFQRTVGASARLQYLEANLGPEKVPDKEIATAFESGRASPKVSFEELVQLHRELEKNLMPYHEQAMSALFAEEGLTDKLSRLLSQIRAAGEYFLPEPAPMTPAIEMAAMSVREGNRPRKPTGIPNPLEIDLAVPESGGDVRILPPETVSPDAETLKQVLAFLRDTKTKFFYGAVFWVADEETMRSPNFGEIPVSKTKMVVLPVPAETSAILVAIGPNEEGVKRAVSAVTSFQPPQEPGFLWITYRPRTMSD